MPRGVGGRGPANIQKHLKGTSYPASKNSLVERAKSGPGPDTGDVVGVLEKIPDREYASPADVMKEIGKVE
ncbi:MAG: hypothetical protein BWY68_00612 [bacterium ADurb.Bin400]|nr:MAG: hypothetical protein BWY68_00612 [bacterium ADurb.Bin400]